MIISKLKHDPKNNNLYVEFKTPIVIEKPFTEGLLYIISKTLANYKISIDGKKRIPTVGTWYKSIEFSTIQINGQDIDLKRDVVYKIDKETFSIMLCIFNTNKNLLAMINKRMSDIWIQTINYVYNLSNDIINSSKSKDVALKDWKYVLTEYENGNLSNLCHTLSQKSFTALTTFFPNGKLTICFSPQNIIYAIPVDIFKNEEKIARSAGYYYTENARKIINMRNSGDMNTSIGKSLDALNAVPIYSYDNEEPYISVYNSAVRLRKDYNAENADICYCTMLDIKNIADKNTLCDDSKKFAYIDNKRMIIFEKDNKKIYDIHST